MNIRRAMNERKNSLTVKKVNSVKALDASFIAVEEIDENLSVEDFKSRKKALIINGEFVRVTNAIKNSLKIVKGQKPFRQDRITKRFNDNFAGKSSSQGRIYTDGEYVYLVYDSYEEFYFAKSKKKIAKYHGEPEPLSAKLYKKISEHCEIGGISEDEKNDAIGKLYKDNPKDPAQLIRHRLMVIEKNDERDIRHVLNIHGRSWKENPIRLHDLAEKNGVSIEAQRMREYRAKENSENEGKKIGSLRRSDEICGLSKKHSISSDTVIRRKKRGTPLDKPTKISCETIFGNLLLKDLYNKILDYSEVDNPCTLNNFHQRFYNEFIKGESDSLLLNREELLMYILPKEAYKRQKNDKEGRAYYVDNKQYLSCKEASHALYAKYNIGTRQKIYELFRNGYTETDILHELSNERDNRGKFNPSYVARNPDEMVRIYFVNFLGGNDCKVGLTYYSVYKRLEKWPNYKVLADLVLRLEDAYKLEQSILSKYRNPSEVVYKKTYYLPGKHEVLLGLSESDISDVVRTMLSCHLFPKKVA